MTESTIHIACICAAWCRLCDEYRQVVRQVMAELASIGQEVHLHWIDLEDDHDLLGDVDVENFPTLVVIDRQRVRFAGAVEPQPDTLRRLLRATVSNALEEDARWPAVSAEIESFAGRLREAARLDNET